MAPAICRLWAGLYDDTWVWEGMPLGRLRKGKNPPESLANSDAATRRMGFLLRELASAFESHVVF
jgi:hypothetical protein